MDLCHIKLFKIGECVMKTKKIGIIVGSLRKDSVNRKIAKALIALAPESLQLEIIEIGGLQIFNQDLEDAPPTEWTIFRESVKNIDGILFVTPEYNRSVPAALKNAIDVGSRPYGANVWSGKPGAVVSASPGTLAGFGANHHLRQSLVFLNVPTMQQPEAYIGNAYALFDGNGNLVNESVSDFLRSFMVAYGEWVAKFTS